MLYSRVRPSALSAFCLTVLSTNLLRPCRAQGALQINSLIPSHQFYSNLTSSIPAYKTIKVTDRDDIKRLYPLLLSYINEPTKTISLREVIVDIYAWPNFYPCLHDEESDDPVLRQESGEELNTKRPNRQVDHHGHSALERHVTSLGLGDRLTDKIVGALAWKKKHWSGEVPDNARDFDDNERMFTSAALIILFSLCENLSVLRISDFPTPLRDYLLKNNYGQLKRFGLQQLKTVQFVKERPLDYRIYEQVDFFEYIRHFGKLPAIECLTMEGVMEVEVNGLGPSGTSNIKIIRLSHSEISGLTLSKMIRSSKALEELRVSSGGLWHMDMGAWGMRPQTVGKSLLQHRNSLRVLELDIAEVDCTEVPSWENEMLKELAEGNDEYVELERKSGTVPFWQEDIPDDRHYGFTIGSLHDFNALTHLSIGLSVMFGPYYERKEPPFRLIDALPPNLEYLCLYGYVKGQNERIDSHVEELMRTKELRLPGLAKVVGVNETVMGVSDIYSFDQHQNEEELWQWPEEKSEWVEA